jgi:hypothetical protein
MDWGSRIIRDVLEDVIEFDFSSTTRAAVGKIRSNAIQIQENSISRFEAVLDGMLLAHSLIVLGLVER